MTLMRTEELKDLLFHRGSCVSIFLPTHQKGAEVQQDSIRLKNLLRAAELDLHSQGVRGSAAEEILSPAQKLVTDAHFWNHQRRGLALFLSRTLSRHLQFPSPFDELIIVAERFHMKPLLPLLNGDGRFYILAASQKRLRFLEGTRETIHEVELAEVPKSLADALRYENPEKQLQFRTQASRASGVRSAVFHGHGGGSDDAEHKKEILRFFRKVDEGIRDFLKGSHPPVVFAGVDYLLPLYREASSYPDLAKDGISGNPDDLSPTELHERAWKLVQPHFLREQREAAERYRERAGTGKAGDTVEEAILAAHQGRVEALFVPIGVRVWGSFEESSGSVRLDSAREPGSEDLIDRAALETILNGGTVYAVKPEEMPTGSTVAALFRY